MYKFSNKFTRAIDRDIQCMIIKSTFLTAFWVYFANTIELKFSKKSIF